MPKIISKDVIEQIRNANDVAEVIGSYFQLKRAGGSFKALCPFHKEKSPSFHVNPQRQIYHCFGCGAGGDVFRFIMQYENVDFGTAARILGERVGMRIEWSEGDGGADSNKGELYKIHEEVAAIYQRALLEMDAAQRARAYLKERDLGDDVVRDFLIGYAPDRRDSLVQWSRKKKLPLQLLEAAGLISHTEDGQPYDRFRNRLMFSIRDELGRVIAFSGRIMEKDVKVAKYVNSPETPLFRKGRVLYALDRARRNIMDTRTAILCEGQIDVIRCHTAGFTTAVASQGTALTEDHARLLKRYADSVIVVLDADKAGQDASLRSAEALFSAGLSVSIAALPKGEDPDSLIRKQGAAGFEKVLQGAQSVLTFHIGVLRAREDLSNEAALMRAAGALIETIARAPSAVQRDRLLHQAAHELGIGENALREDLNVRLDRAARPASRAAAAAAPTARKSHPPEELQLAELIAAFPETAEVVRHFLKLEHLSDDLCRKIIGALTSTAGGPAANLMSELADEDEECQRLAAEIQMAPPKVVGSDVSPEEAAQDLILVIRRKQLERQRVELRKQIETASGPERDRLDMESKQLTLDIKLLQQGWEKAVSILHL